MELCFFMMHVKQWSNFEDDLSQIWLFGLYQVYLANTCKINEMIKCVSMLIFRIIRDFLILFCFILYFIYNVVNIVAM